MASKITGFEERFGKVLLLSETNKADRKTVSFSVVSESQFKFGCEGTPLRKIQLL
ncbi:MAG: hypothetical protein ACJAV1_001750 [Paraglaciecola sp.]|jgi:hypothetical protein